MSDTISNLRMAVEARQDIMMEHHTLHERLDTTNEALLRFTLRAIAEGQPISDVLAAVDASDEQPDLRQQFMRAIGADTSSPDPRMTRHDFALTAAQEVFRMIMEAE